MRLLAFAVLLLALAAATPARSQTLTVGAPERPPFASRGTDNSWEGIGVDLWRTIAEQLSLSYRIVPVDETRMEAALGSSEIDIALALDATPGAIDTATLTLPYYTATLALASEREFAFWRIAQNIVTLEFVRIIAWLSALLLVVGALVWLLERRRNAKQFSPKPLAGLGDGFWWAGVTLTTIGYGDKAPITVAGRALAMLWMLIGLAVSAALTAAVVSATNVTGTTTLTIPTDVAGRTIAVVPGGSAEAYLTGFGIDLVRVDDFVAGIAAVKAGEADAVAGGAPELRATLRRLGSDLAVSATRQDPQYVVFGLSPRLDPAATTAISRAVVDRITSEDWWLLVDRYLPEDR